MSKKRNNPAINSANKRNKKPLEYPGYRPNDTHTSIDEITIDEISKDTFFAKYVIPRRPVKILGCVPGIDIGEFQPDKLVAFLDYEEELQVEKKIQGGFGSGKKRVKMALSDLMERFSEGDDSLYLTTQYLEDEPDFVAEKPEIDVEEEQEEPDSEEELGTTFGTNLDSDFSDTDSITFDNLKDDFEDEEENDDDDSDLIDTVLGVTRDEAERRVAELVQRPLTNLAKSDVFPLIPELFGFFVPQQINLWMGVAKPTSQPIEKIQESSKDLGLGRRIPGSGTSSGLHHDHADNIYVPIRGKKRFTLFSPFDADHMYTVGQISKIYPTGVIDYETNEQAPDWRHVRDDGALVTEIARWKLENDKNLSKKSRKELIQLIENEEEMMENAEQSPTEERRDPPSFSRIPPFVCHLDEVSDESLRNEIESATNKKYPGFLQTNRITVELEPGQMLYLPAGWFHEVTSFASSTDNIHTALNYWFLPPNGVSSEKPYQDTYWAEDYERTEKSLAYWRQL